MNRRQHILNLLEREMDRTIIEIEQQVDAALGSRLDDVDVKETIGSGEALFVECQVCGKAALNTGRGVCIDCDNLLMNSVCQNCGMPNKKHSFHGDCCPDDSKRKFKPFEGGRNDAR